MSRHHAEERYLPEHVHEALLADDRVGEQDLQVRADEHCIHVAARSPPRPDAMP